MQYIQNINYKRQQQTLDEYYTSPELTLDQEIEDFISLCRAKENIQTADIYRKIRAFIYKEIKIKQLAVCRVLTDLEFIRNKNPRIADYIEYFIAHNTDSYQQMADHFGITKQAFYCTIKKYAPSCKWLKGLYNMKSIYDSRNQRLPNDIKRKLQKDDEE